MSERSRDKKLLRVLIVNDSYADYLVTRDAVVGISQFDFQTQWCPDCRLALDSMFEGSSDVYVIDYRLNGKTGTDHLIEAIIDFCEQPVILLTGRENFSVDKQATSPSVSRILKSELSSERLGSLFTNALLQATLRQERARA